MLELGIALLVFIGSHELLSHPLRAPLVAKIGEAGFAGVYSLVALGSFYWVITAWRAAPPMPLWVAPDWGWNVASVLMAVAAVLFVGSVTVPNPAMTGMGGSAGSGPRGVLRITRHPMMWAFALWAAVHAGLSGDAATVLFCAGFGFLALFGAYMQDGKKRAQLGQGWVAHEASTSFVPFARQATGRAGLATLYPGAAALIGGAALWLAATWAHPQLGGPVVGIWSLL